MFLKKTIMQETKIAGTCTNNFSYVYQQKEVNRDMWILHFLIFKFSKDYGFESKSKRKTPEDR